MAAQIDLNHKVHVLTKKEELDTVRLPGKVVVVLDILFATTTMVTALAHGAREVVPVLDEAAAYAESTKFSENSFVLAGELYAETLPGFAHPAPLSLLGHGIEGKSVIYSTTNGTVAMGLAAPASRVYCGVAQCAGAGRAHRGAAPRRNSAHRLLRLGNNFNLEDFYGAGYFVERLFSHVTDLDAAKAALRSTATPRPRSTARLPRWPHDGGARPGTKWNLPAAATPFRSSRRSKAVAYGCLRDAR